MWSQDQRGVQSCLAHMLVKSHDGNLQTACQEFRGTSNHHQHVVEHLCAALAVTYLDRPQYDTYFGMRQNYVTQTAEMVPA